MKKRANYVVLALLAPLLVYAAADFMHLYSTNTPAAEADTLALLLPDNVDPTTPAAQEWLDAAD